MMKKKLLAVLLCLTLAAGLLPTTVWAAETGCLKHKEYTVRGANFNENTVVETLPSCNSLSPKIGSSINTLLWGALLFCQQRHCGNYYYCEALKFCAGFV